MDFFIAILLGIIQGVAEWLPISSEAMVTLAGKFIAGMEYQEALSTAIWLHLGTSISAIIYFRKDILSIIKSGYEKGAEKSLLIFLIITTIGSVLIAFPLLFFAFSIALSESVITIIIGIFLICIAFLQKKRISGTESSLTPTKAFIAGIVQGLSALPGLSRSGLTLTVLLTQKFPLKQAFKLSFLMSIPVTLGAQIALPIVKDGFEISFELIISTAVAAIVGLLTIKLLMELAEQINFFKATLTLGILVLILGTLTLML